MVSKDDNRYLTVADAFASVGKVVNLIGVIVHHTQPARSQGTDYWCSISVVDPSHSCYGLVVAVFSRSMDRLPRVECRGDIIVFSQVLIQVYQSKTSARFNKKNSSFALYEGMYGQRFTPYQAYSKFRPGEQVEKTVAELREWMDNAELDTVLKKSTLLSEIRKEEKIDLVCKILHISKISQGEVMLFVWDGTDAPPCNIQEKLDDEKESPLPLGEKKSRDILSKFPTVGTVLRVIAERKRGELEPSSKSVGRWAKLINLAFDVHAGLWYGYFSPCTKFRYVPDGDRHVLECLSFEKRFKSRWNRRPITSPWPLTITETEHQDVPVVTLMDIINYSKDTVKFRCVVRVVSMLPFNPKDFFCPKGQYRVQLTLEDPTARINAYLFAKDAEKFFGGNPGMYELSRKRNKILGINGCSESEDSAGNRDPPWMVCGIFSKYLDKDKESETRTFMVFMTKLVC